MTRMAPAEIYAVALQAGFSPADAVTFTAIALAESGGESTANAAGSEDSRGLWQINVSPGVRANRWGDLYDPVVNARAAYEVSDGGSNIQPWSVTHEQHRGTSRDYRQYLDEAQAAAAGSGAGGGGPRAVDVFVQAALDQVGDSYVFGADVDLADADPETFDCSELTQWAAHQVGVTLGEATYIQYLDLKDQGSTMTVEEAIDTKGALLFHFSSEPTPGGGRPPQAHVAISLGDGRIVEAANPSSGVVISEADPDRFNFAAAIPGLDAAAPRGGTALAADSDQAAFALSVEALPPPTDGDGDGLTDEFEQLLGTDPASADTDRDDLSDLHETTRSHTDPLAADTDADGIGDALEVAQGTDAGQHRLSDEVVAAGFGGAGTADVDDDGLSDLLEHRLGSNRDDADTDHDGVRDDLEHALGSDLGSIDTDRDGLTDGVALDMGVLGPRPTGLGLPGPDPADGVPAGVGSSADPGGDDDVSL